MLTFRITFYCNMTILTCCIVLLSFCISFTRAAASPQDIVIPPGVNKNRFIRCHNIVHRLYVFLDTDGDGVLEDHEIKNSDLSALGLTDHDRVHMIEGCYFIAEMTTEDVHMYFHRCAKMEQYLAHFQRLDGQDIFERFMDPASDSLMEQMLIPISDRVQLRRILFKSLLQADREDILQRVKTLQQKQGLLPIISDIRTTSLTVRLPSVQQASGYKVQYCEIDDGKVHGETTIDVCGFAWSAVYPTAGVHLIKLYGLSPKGKYKIRVRAFFCDGASVVGKTISITTPKDRQKLKAVDMKTTASSNMSINSAHQPNPTIKRVSASRDTILLSWDGGCRVDANRLRAIKSNSKITGTSEEVCTDPSMLAEAATAADSLVRSAGSSRPSLASLPSSLEEHVPVMWEVKYDRDEGMVWKGNWQTAGCIEARRVDNMNDDPFSCFISGLKEGRRYKFAVFGTMSDGRTEIISKISRHMTACDDDADCYGEKICSPSFKCVAPQFSKRTAMWLLFVLIILSLISFVVVHICYTKETNHDTDIMQCIDEKHRTMSIIFDGSVKLVNGKKVTVKNLKPEKIFKWKKSKEESELFLFEKFQHQFFISVDGTCFMCERYLGGGGFGRVFLLRPVVRNNSKDFITSSSSSSITSTKDETTWTSTNDEDPSISPYTMIQGRCMAIKFLKPNEMAKEVDMIQKHLDYHPNVSRPRFWSRTGFQAGLHVHIAPNNSFLIMPYLPLGSLNMFIPDTRSKRKPLPPRVVRRITHQALKGLNHLHKYGYIHLDIKPDNMMLSSEGVLKLVDFGEMEYIEPNNVDGVDGVTHNTWDNGRSTVMFAAPELGSPFGPDEEDPYTYHHPDGRRFYYCERAGHYDTCGFNHKVDIYALGISILSMVKGYRLLVDEEDQGPIRGHHNDRLTCCESMGTFSDASNSSKKLDVQKLMKDVPEIYRLKGKVDFLVFLKKMICNVNERLSARALLSERTGKTWLRIHAKDDERSITERAEVKTHTSSASTASTTTKRNKNTKTFHSQDSVGSQGDDDFIGNYDSSELRENTNDSDAEPGIRKSLSAGASAGGSNATFLTKHLATTTSAKTTAEQIDEFHPDATLDEMCKFLVEYDKTLPKVKEYNLRMTKHNNNMSHANEEEHGTVAKRKCFIETSLELMPTTDEIIPPLAKSKQGNTSLGYELQRVQNTKLLLEKYIKHQRQHELELLKKQNDVHVNNVEEFFDVCWSTKYNIDASDREKKEAQDIILLMVQYCRSNHIHHVATLDVRKIILVLSTYYSYKTKIKKRKSILSKIKSFRKTLHDEFCAVWDRSVDTGLHVRSVNSGSDSTSSVVGERIVGDVDVSALWCPIDHKCGWVWVRTGYLKNDHGAILKTTSTMAELHRSSSRDSTMFNRSNSIGSSHDMNQNVNVTKSKDNLEWKRLFVMFNASTNVMSCYNNIIDCINNVNEIEDVMIDHHIHKWIVQDDSQCRDAMSSASTQFDCTIGLYSNVANIDDGKAAEMSCCIPDECQNVIIIRRENDFMFLGFESQAEIKITKDYKKQTWLDVIECAYKGEERKKPKSKGWGGNTRFNVDGIYDPNGK